MVQPYASTHNTFPQLFPIKIIFRVHPSEKTLQVDSNLITIGYQSLNQTWPTKPPHFGCLASQVHEQDYRFPLLQRPNKIIGFLFTNIRTRTPFSGSKGILWSSSDSSPDLMHEHHVAGFASITWDSEFVFLTLWSSSAKQNSYHLQQDPNSTKRSGFLHFDTKFRCRMTDPSPWSMYVQTKQKKR